MLQTLLKGHDTNINTNQSAWTGMKTQTDALGPPAISSTYVTEHEKTGLMCTWNFTYFQTLKFNNFLAEKHRESYRSWVAYRKGGICTQMWTGVFCAHKTLFLMPGHICYWCVHTPKLGTRTTRPPSVRIGRWTGSTRINLDLLDFALLLIDC